MVDVALLGLPAYHRLKIKRLQTCVSVHTLIMTTPAHVVLYTTPWHVHHFNSFIVEYTGLT